MVPLLANATAVTAEEFTSVLTAIQNQISISSIVGVLGIAAGACVGFAFMWWGVRKLTRMIMKAAKRGKIPM